jgi:DNA polymerase-3 subunit gamma/tau
VAYTVLARKYRSRTFEEVIGQKPIATTLVNAIRTGRIHHGYLFTGPRGTGKTSMARILARSLNCLRADGPTLTPCLECDSCVAIAEGQDIDVIEIDAASNTGVDNIRELRSNTAYRPARSRFKIYIIDEVHMLSTGAFNALLKTLEEPPEHVKFILATTEVQKVPATIQSRCQRFNFRHISPEAIAARLEQIVQAEGATAEPAVLRRVARLAGGSMRDALSIVDQLLSVSPGGITSELLDELLPPPQHEQILRLLRHAADGEVALVLKGADDYLNQGGSTEVFCTDAIEVARTLMLLRACGPEQTLVDVPAAGRAEYLELAGRFELSQYVQMIAMLEELRRNARFSAAGRALVDATLVRLAHLNTWAPIEQLLLRLTPGESAAQAAEKKKTCAAIKLPPARVTAGIVLPPRPASEPPALDWALANETGRRSAPPPSDGRRRYDETPETYGAERAITAAAAPAGGSGSAVPASPWATGASSLRSPARPAPSPAGLPRPVSAAQRERVLANPVVRQVIELLGAELVNIEINDAETRPGNADPGGPLAGAEP